VATPASTAPRPEAPGRRPAAAWELALLAAITLVAACLRFYRLSWGLEDGVYFPDEWVWWRRGAAFVPLSCDSFEAIGLPMYPYPTLYGYAVGAVTALATAAGAMDPPSQPPAHPDLEVIALARALAAAASVAAVALTGWLGARLYRWPVGLCAAALLAVTPLDAWQVHYASVDPLLALLGVAVLLPSHAYLERGGLLAAAGAGALAGLALAAKFTGGLAVAPVAFALLARAWRERSFAGLLRDGTVAVAGFAGALALACPPCVLEADRFLRAFNWVNHVVWSTDTFPGARLAPSVGWYAKPYLYQLVAALPWSLGWPLYALALGGVGFALRRRTAADALVLAALVPYFLVVCAAPLAFARYLLPLVPGLLLLGARALCALPAPRLRAAAFAVCWLYSAALSFSQISGFSLEQQREVARWIAERSRGAGPSARVVVPESMSGYDALLPFLHAQGLRPLKGREGEWWGRRAEFLVLPERLAALHLRGDPDGVLAQDVLRLRAGATPYREVARWPDRYPQRALYAWLDPGLHPALGAYGYTVYRYGAGAPAEAGAPR
jgi:4-amino-4-deoxy-L-arabinose transferase-like glycosyltransferase